MTTRVGSRHIDGRPVWFVAWESQDGRRRLFWYVPNREQAVVMRRQLQEWEANSSPGAAGEANLAAD